MKKLLLSLMLETVLVTPVQAGLLGLTRMEPIRALFGQSRRQQEARQPMTLPASLTRMSEGSGPQISAPPKTRKRQQPAVFDYGPLGPPPPKGRG